MSDTLTPAVIFRQTLFALFFRYSRRQGVGCGGQQVSLIDEAWTGMIEINLQGK